MFTPLSNWADWHRFLDFGLFTVVLNALLVLSLWGISCSLEVSVIFFRSISIYIVVIWRRFHGLLVCAKQNPFIGRVCWRSSLMIRTTPLFWLFWDDILSFGCSIWNELGLYNSQLACFGVIIVLAVFVYQVVITFLLGFPYELEVDTYSL